MLALLSQRIIRPGQFDYAGAKAKELPIGSGKVESTHKSLAMANLRTLRANDGWELLWNK